MLPCASDIKIPEAHGYIVCLGYLLEAHIYMVRLKLHVLL